MTAHAHDIWLNVRRKGLDVIRKILTVFLALGPVRTVRIEVCNQSIFIAESKGVSGVILPSDVHR